MQALSSPGVLGRRAICIAIRYVHFVYNAIGIVCLALAAIMYIAIRYIAIIMHIAIRYVAALYVARKNIRMSSEIFSNLF